MTRNQLQYWANQETKSNNAEVRKETGRHNRAMEKLERYKHDNTLLLGQGNLNELIRSNQAREGENVRSNLANEDIKRMANLIAQHQADTARMNAYTNAAGVAENRRSNLANESLRDQELSEKIRKDTADISNANLRAITDYANVENNRDRWVTELQARYQELDELSRHNIATEEETARKNKLDQEIRSLELEHKIEIDSNDQLRKWIKDMNDAIRGYSGIGWSNQTQK